MLFLPAQLRSVDPCTAMDNTSRQYKLSYEVTVEREKEKPGRNKQRHLVFEAATSVTKLHPIRSLPRTMSSLNLAKRYFLDRQDGASSKSRSPKHSSPHASSSRVSSRYTSSSGRKSTSKGGNVDEKKRRVHSCSAKNSSRSETAPEKRRHSKSSSTSKSSGSDTSSAQSSRHGCRHGCRCRCNSLPVRYVSSSQVRQGTFAEASVPKRRSASRSSLVTESSSSRRKYSSKVPVWSVSSNGQYRQRMMPAPVSVLSDGQRRVKASSVDKQVRFSTSKEVFVF